MRPPGAGASFDWTCGQGTSVILAETCQPGNSTPRFLAAQRSAVSSRREEIAFVALAAQHNTRVCGPLCDPRGASFILPHRSSIFYGFRKHSRSGLQLQSGMQCVQRSDCRAANLTVFRRRKAFLLCKNPCGGDCGGDGVPAAVGRGTARAKKFPEEICFAPSRVFQVCRTPDYLVLKST